MKTILLSIALLATAQLASAQNFMTRTGRVTFFSSTPIENIEAVNNEASAAVNAGTGEVVFQVPIKSFRFPNALMQDHFNENYMESDKFPKAMFKGKLTSPVSFDKDGAYKTSVSGDLTIHGVTKQVTVPGTITMKNGVATINTTFKIAPKDYGVKVPAGGKVSDNLEITVATPLNKK